LRHPDDAEQVEGAPFWALPISRRTGKTSLEPRSTPCWRRVTEPSPNSSTGHPYTRDIGLRQRPIYDSQI
jgi:hypothetical protein